MLMIEPMLTQTSNKALQPYEVNPAFKSVIGRVNYARRYGLSIQLFLVAVGEI